MPASDANPTTDAMARDAIDDLTLETCKNAAASPSNVQIYTIGFSTPNDPIDQQGINMLSTCAGSSERAFVANDSAGIIAAFQKIADNIGNLRLTH